jgi:signal recognition particle receptor subunit beta
MYTVPGQVKYNSTRRLVLRNCDGVVFCLDSQWEKIEENVESWKNLEENLEAQRTPIGEMPYIIQYNKQDLPNVAPREYLDFLMNNGDKAVPVYVASAINGVGVMESLNGVSKLVIQDFINKH